MKKKLTGEQRRDIAENTIRDMKETNEKVFKRIKGKIDIKDITKKKVGVNIHITKVSKKENQTNETK